jgi:hypothetical protein
VTTPASPQNKEPFESYLISYSPVGKMLWQKQSESQTMVHKIAASNESVFISYLWNSTVKMAYQIAADTSNRKSLVIASFSKAGKLQWHTTHGAAIVQQLVSVNNQLFVAGATRYGSNTGVVGNYTLERIEHSYIAVYSKNGTFLKVQPLKTDFDDKPEPVFVYPVSDHEIYLAFSMFISINMPMSIYEKLFRDIKNSAYVGVIGKIHY